MFSEEHKGNGAEPEMLGTLPRHERLVLAYDRATDALEVTGNTGSLESALAMLRRAVFEYEMQLRALRAQQMAAAAVERQQAAQLAESLKSKLRV